MSNEIDKEPIGWWYSYVGAYYWRGPFETRDKAVANAIAMSGEPLKIEVLEVRPWSRKTFTPSSDHPEA